MNAMTGPDYTLYPYATQNRQDYYNLMGVYLDAVFKPLLSEKDFLQEGWRLDVDDKDPDKLILKGNDITLLPFRTKAKGVLKRNRSLVC